MGKDKKKKGQGAAKTALKTEKKEAKKLKKELRAKGEEDIESMIAKFTLEDQRRATISEELSQPPSRRSNFTFQPHPEKDELYFFGGEFFNGKKTFMYNDLYKYNIKKNEWTLIKTPVSPPPRCAHQAVSVPAGGGQLWIFGGEFASPTQSQFYHYKDLWVYHMKMKTWEKINVKNGPSARSGHRMCAYKRNIFVFGGFHDNLKDYKYYNDVYMFNLDNYEWTKLSINENAPCPRSACQISCTDDGKIIVYGGYSKTKGKKDSENGIVHSDMFTLQQDSKNQSLWKWNQLRQTGMRPIPRSGFSLAAIGNNRAILFGGVQDEEDEENDEDLRGNFFNDLYQLELDKGKWTQLTLKGHEKVEKKSRRKKKDCEELADGSVSDECDEEEEEEAVAATPIAEPKIQKADSDEDVFKVTIGSQSAATSLCDSSKLSNSDGATNTILPHSRMNAALTYKHGSLYLYGGSFEVGDKQITLKDFHCLDVHKLDEWKTLIEIDKEHEWIDSESDDDSEDGTGSDEDTED